MSFVRSHAPEEQLESYSMGRLEDPELSVVEEHLMVCAQCRTRVEELDSFVACLRVAAENLEANEAKAKPETGILSRLLAKLSFSLPVSAGALAAVCALMLVIPAVRTARLTDSSETVSLRAIRGAVESPVITASSRKTIDLNISLEEIPSIARYGIEVVDSSGRQLMKRDVAPVDGHLAVRLDQKLNSGQYWVRLYNGTELLREFGLEAK